jgi:thiamine pyrophosphate-dependent acetolactate synthase large subunit-like protein
VHLDLVTSKKPVFIARSFQGASHGAATRDWAAIRSLLERSKRPLVIAGGLAARLGWGEKLSALRVPVMTTAIAKGLID